MLSRLSQVCDQTDISACRQAALACPEGWATDDHCCLLTERTGVKLNELSVIYAQSAGEVPHEVFANKNLTDALPTRVVSGNKEEAEEEEEEEEM